MGASAGGRLARGLAVALVGLALPASASAAAVVTKLSPKSQTLTIPSAAGGSCTTRQSAGTRGVAVSRYTAASARPLPAHLPSVDYDDWDPDMFDAASGLRLDASLGFGANEIVQAVVQKGAGARDP